MVVRVSTVYLFFKIILSWEPLRFSRTVLRATRGGFGTSYS